MLALTDAALAHLCIAATVIPRRARSRWLREFARTIEDRCRRSDAPGMRASAVMQPGSAQGFYGT